MYASGACFLYIEYATICIFVHNDITRFIHDLVRGGSSGFFVVRGSLDPGRDRSGSSPLPVLVLLLRNGSGSSGSPDQAGILCLSPPGGMVASPCDGNSSGSSPPGKQIRIPDMETASQDGGVYPGGCQL